MFMLHSLLIMASEFPHFAVNISMPLRMSCCLGSVTQHSPCCIAMPQKLPYSVSGASMDKYGVLGWWSNGQQLNWHWQSQENIVHETQQRQSVCCTGLNSDATNGHTVANLCHYNQLRNSVLVASDRAIVCHCLSVPVFQQSPGAIQAVVWGPMLQQFAFQTQRYQDHSPSYI